MDEVEANVLSVFFLFFFATLMAMAVTTITPTETVLKMMVIISDVHFSHARSTLATMTMYKYHKNVFVALDACWSSYDRQQSEQQK